MPGLSSPILTGTAHKEATITLEIGPANETVAMPERMWLPNLVGFTGVGLPQPNPTTTIMTVPAGSRCASGFSVSLPWFFAVLSPSRLALRAWLNSCTVIAATMASVNPKRVSTAFVGS